MAINISIIVPVYKAEAYLTHCINSILHQTYKDFELILVDDGSPDRSGAICDQYAAIDSRIKVIHKENGGAGSSAGSARNAGLDIARGAYIGFVDSDDYIDKSMYEVLLNNIKSYDADISQCKFLRVHDFKSKKNQESNQIEVLSNIEALNNLYNLTNDNNNNAIVIWNKLYKRSLFEGLRFPADRMYEDEFTTYKLLYKACKIVNTDATLYYYYQSSNSVMRSGFYLKKLDGLEAFKQRKAFFKQENLPELYKKACQSYGDFSIKYYFNVKNELVDNDDLLKSLKKEFDQYLSEMIKEKVLPAKQLARFGVFYIIPNLYPVALKVKAILAGQPQEFLK